MPADRFSHTITVTSSPEEIWTALQDAETWAHIGPVSEVWDAQHGSDGQLASYRWSADAAGRRWEGTARTTAADPNRHMQLALASPELQGTLTTEIAPGDGDSTTLTVILEAKAVGMMATLFWGVVRQAIGTGLPHQVEEFGERFRD